MGSFPVVVQGDGSRHTATSTFPLRTGDLPAAIGGLGAAALPPSSATRRNVLSNGVV
jgi:hypothetical protein